MMMMLMMLIIMVVIVMVMMMKSALDTKSVRHACKTPTRTGGQAITEMTERN
jgi:hypothetical protein